MSKRDEFDTRSEVSKTESQISFGNRVSQFGFTDMFGLSKTQMAKQTKEFETEYDDHIKGLKKEKKKNNDQEK